MTENYSENITLMDVLSLTTVADVIKNEEWRLLDSRGLVGFVHWIRVRQRELGTLNSLVTNELLSCR